MSGDPYECPRCGGRTVTLACAEGRCARPVVSRRDADGKPIAWIVGLVDLDLGSFATVEALGDGAVDPALMASGSRFDPRRDLPARVQRALWPKCGAVDLAPDGSATAVVPDPAEAEEIASTSDELERHRRDAAFWREQHGRAVAMRDEEIRRYQEGAVSLRAQLDAALAERDALLAENSRLAALASRAAQLTLQRNHHHERHWDLSTRIHWMQSIAAAAMRQGLAACRALRSAVARREALLDELAPGWRERAEPHLNPNDPTEGPR